VVSARALQLSAADINWPATRMAQELIRSGRVKPAPAPAVAGAAVAGASTAPAGGATANDPAAATATPQPAPPAPVVHPVKRPPPPSAAAPAPAPATTQPAQVAADPTPAAVIDAPPVEVQQAVVALVEQAPEQTRQDIVSGRQVIYTLHVLDNMADDGDRVTVTVGGSSFGPVTVTLTNRGQDLLIPLVAGAPSTVKVYAAYDGGGGVTFGAYSSLGETRSRVMAVGQSDEWTVVTQ
jgi:hypothetical protein